MPTNRYRFAIDDRPQIDVGAAAVGDPTDDYAPPAPKTAPPSIINLSLSTGLSQTDRSARAFIDAAWNTIGAVVHFFEFEASFDDFATIDRAGRASSESVRIDGVRPGTSYKVRVRAVYSEARSPWTVAGPITTAVDTTPPSLPTSNSLSFATNSDLVLVGTLPTEQNFARLEVVIRGSGAGPTYATLNVAGEPGAAYRLVWTADDNVRLAGGDPTITVVIRSQNWSNYFSTSSVTLSATKSLPTLSASVDFTGPDAIYSLSPSADVARISFVADTGVTAREIGVVGRFAYDFDQNRVDHSGTADYSLSYSFTAYDALGQAATAVTGTVTNPVPSDAVAGNINVSGQFALQLVLVYTEPADFAYYTYRIVKDGTTLATHTGRSKSQTYNVSTRGSYQIGITVTDMFGRSSTEVLSSAAVLEFMTVDDLRKTLRYDDSISTAAATLDALKDESVTTNVVTYASGSTWKWTEATSELIDPIGNITISATAGVGYVALSTDKTNYTFYSGPLGSDGRTLTLIGTGTLGSATETSAQSVAVSLPTSGAYRFDLPSRKEARYIRLGHRNTGATYSLREFYPRRRVVADDIYTQTLAAISADLGTINAGTVTGATIRTNTSGPRIEMNNAKIFGTDGTTEQWSADNTDGKFKAGAGKVVLDASGITNTLESGTPNVTAIKWRAGGTGTLRSYIYGGDAGLGYSQLYLAAQGAVNSGDVSLPHAKVVLDAYRYNRSANIVLDANGSAAQINCNADAIALNGVVTAGEGVAASSSWPTAPTFGRITNKVGVGWCYYDGTQWLTVQVFERSFGYTSGVSASGDIFATLQSMPGAYVPYFTRMDFAVGINAVNNASNYWGVVLRNAGSSSIVSANTNTLAAGSGQNRISVTSGFVQPASAPIYVNLSAVKNGAPSNIDLYGTVWFQLIIP